MDQDMFLAPAVQCVQALQMSSESDDDHLFQDPSNNSIASAISMLAHTAQFIEHTVKQSSKLHELGILIACRVHDTKETDSSRSQTVLVWNSLTDRPKSQGLSAQEIVSHPQHSNRKESPPPDSRLGEIPEFSQRPERSQPQQRELAFHNGLRKKKHEHSPEECSYTVPVDVAAKCLGLLLDGSGFSAHKNIFQKRSYTELGTKPLIDVLKKVFKAESERRAIGNPSLPSTNGSTKDSMIYSDLLPDHLREANHHENISASVPEIVLEEEGGMTIPQYMKVKMNIRKPDRNKKHQNFAVLCALLHHTGPTGVCARTLREYAKQGFTVEGCRRRERYSTSSKSSCGGALGSCQENRKLCSFFISSDATPVGKGTVDPFAAETDGKNVTEGCVLVRFAQTRNLQDINFPSDLSMEEKTIRHTSWTNGTLTVWPRSNIERIELMGDYGKPIGTGIFVQDLIQNDSHDAVVKRIRRSSNRRNTMDVINAIVVCDVYLLKSTNEASLVYPYMEWYNISCFKMLQRLHFDGVSPPKTLSPFVLRSCKALLWNKHHFRRKQTRES